ncbi:MAG: DUF1211 domain-containing protein [Candidimonas sp.]|nr:MAG: DUF1211 domain-containing protein [Candidimonas sp.]
MNKGRMEAFSDGVLAIILTIMVLSMQVPKGVSFAALLPVVPVFLSYILSFIYVGIYWNNHHHMLHTVTHVTGSILWANLHLLFWLSLLPFATGWMGENSFAAPALFLYGVVLLGCAIAYRILQIRIIASEGPDSVLAKAVGQDRKGTTSIVLYVLGVMTSFASPWLSGACYIATAILWLVPDRRVERQIQ